MANWVSAPAKKQTKKSTWVTATGEVSDYSPEVHKQAAYEAITEPVFKNTSGIMDPIKRQQQIEANMKGFSSYSEMQRYNKNNPHLSEVMGGQKYNPIPAKNPTMLNDEGMKLVEEAQKRDAAYRQGLATADQKKSTAQKAKAEYEKAADWFASFKDDSGNIVSDILDMGPSRYKADYKDNYEKAATDYVTAKFYSKEAAEKELSTLENKLKSVKDKTEKQEIKNEIDIMRTGLYGKYSVGEHLWANVDAGAAQFNKSLSATADFLVGNVLKAFGWENNPITKWDNWHQKQLEAASQNAQNSANSIGDKSNISGQVIQGATAALPDAILAIITAGTSSITSAIKTASASTSALSMVKNAITTTAKNPSYWFAFTRELGTNYQEAKANGATEGEATLYALLSSTVNSVVEVGGGIQTLPDAVQTAYKSGMLFEWFKSALEEGGEEMVQGIISGLTEKAVYNPDKEVLSTTNDGAIINPTKLLKEGGMGVAVGAILGGGQLSINTILNAKSESEYKQLGKAVLADKNIDIKGIVEYSKKSADNGIRQLALDTNANKVTSRTAGILYQYAVSDIRGAINTPTDIDTATKNFSDILENTDSKIIKSIASSQYVLRLMENGMTEDVANGHIENINSSLQISDNSGIINNNSDINGVENNELYQQGTVVGSAEGYENQRRIDTRGTSTANRVFGETEESFTRRTQESGNSNRQIVKYSNSALSYTEKSIDNSPTGKAIQLLNKAGIKAVYCDGDIETNENSVTKVHGDALTAPDGTVYVSSNSPLSENEISTHESVHAKDKTNSEAFMEYESAVTENILIDSEKFSEICSLINDNHYGGKYDVEDISNAGLFLKEILAYINQFVMTDPQFAEQLFGGMFSDWNAVVEAAHKFNSDIGLDIPETTVLQSSAKDNDVSTDDEDLVFTDSKSQDIHREPTKEQLFKTIDGKPINDIQKQIEAICKKFGIKLIWTTNVKRGKYRPADNVMLMNPNQKLSWMYTQIFKHEFLHYLKYRKGFEKFKKEVFENSPAFVEYIRGRLLKVNDVEFFGSDQEAIEEYTKYKYDEYRNSDELTEIVRLQFTMEDAREEVLADFVGDMLFGSIDYDESVRLLQKLSVENPGVIKRIREWLKSLIERLRGEKQNSDVVADVLRLDKMLERVLQSKELDRTDGVEKNLIAKTINMDWNTQITALLNNSGSIVRNDTLVVDNNTPLYLQNKKTKNLPLAIPISVITKAKSGKDISHSISKNNLKELQKGIRNADVIIDNPERNSIVFVTDIKQDNHPVLVSFEKNAVFDGDEVHKATSIHLQIDTKSMLEALPEKATIYFKTKKEFDSVVGATNKLRGLATNIKFIDEIVSRNSKKVNEKNSITTPNKVSVEKLAKRILRQNKSEYDAGELKRKLNHVFSFMAESDWGMAYDQALDAARTVFEMSRLGVEITEDAIEVLRLIRTTPVRLDSVQKAEAAVSYGSYNNFRKRNMGRISIKKDAIPLETAWSEWSNEYPDLFDKDLTSADMPNALCTIIENLKSWHEDFDTEGAIQDLASRIINEAANEMYNPLSKQLQEAVAETKKIYEKQHIEDVRFMAQQKTKIERLKADLKRRRAEVAEDYAAEREEKSTKQKNIEHIRKVVARIDRKLRTNSTSQNIPEDLKPAMAQFVKIFLSNDTSPFNKKDLNYLKTVYKNAVFESENNIVFDDGIAEDLKTLEERLEGKTLRELNYYDTLLIRMIVDHFQHVLSMKNEMFIADRKYETDQLGNAAINEVSSVKSKRTNFLIDGLEKVKYSNMTPIYFFDRLGGTFKMLFNDILYGQDKWYRNVEISKTFITEIKEKYHYDKWDLKEKLKLKTVLGDEIEITREQAMLLYATANREYGNNFQESEHLFKGGVVIEPSKKTVRETIAQLGEKGADSEKIIKAFTSELNAKRHRITPADAGEIKNWLTEEQKAYADAFVDYLSKDMASLGNEVSMKLYGIKKYNEDYYIPYNSAANYLYSQPGITNEARIKHQSFTKETQRHASTPLVLSDFSSVCADHINRMCMYNAMTLPLENMTKIFNYQKFREDGNGGRELTTDMKAEIANAYGTEAVDYILQFLNDMNGNVRISSADKFTNNMISKFKKGAVFASASVVVQQPSAIMRAMAYVNPKYFIKTSFRLAERNYQEAIKYAPVAGIKDMGRFDTGVGIATTNWLLQQTPKGVSDKAKALVSNDSAYRDDKLSYFAAKADEITWSHIWAAVKAEISDTTEFKVDSEEFLEACGKRFTEVINYTQVYDSTLSRSQLMRDKSTGAQMLTAFMSEPTVSLNLLVNAVHEFKTGGKDGKKYFGRAVGAFVGNVIVNAVLKSLVTSARDDDEDKSYWEKYLGNVAANIISDLNPLSLIPFAKDIISIFEGYSVERADMELFSDLAQSINIINNDNKTIYEKIEALAGSLAAFVGLPVKNVLRDCRAAYNVFKDFVKNKNTTTTEGVKYAAIESVTGEDSNKHYYEQMVKAADKGDYQKYNELFEYLKGKDIEEKNIYSGIKSAYKRSKEVEKESQKQTKGLSDNNTYISFDDEEKKKVENTIKTVIATQNMLEDISKKHYDDFDRIYEYKRKGNKKAREDLVQKLLKEGLTQSQIDDGETIAKYAYLKSIGVNLADYAMAQIAVNESNADLDNSGGVSKLEKKKAINNMDVDEKTKSGLRKFYN